MVEVKFFQTATMRKTGVMKDGEVCGTFFVNITPQEIPAVCEELKGKKTASGEDMYEIAVERRNKAVEKAILDCKFLACDKVRGYIGPEGVLVASIPEEETPAEETTETTKEDK